MGWFSSKKQEHVGNVAIRLLDDKEFKYSNQMAMNDYIFKNSDMVQSMIDHANGALPRKIERAYKIASKADRYVFGLPMDSVLSKPVDDVLSATKRYLKKIENTDIEILYNHIGELNVYHAVWFKLIQDYQYNSVDNTLMYQGNQVYLFDVDLLLNQAIDKIDYPLAFNFGKALDRKQDIKRVVKPIGLSDKDKAIVYIQYSKQVENPNYVPYELATVDKLDSYIDEPEFILENVIDSFELDLSFLNPKQEVGDDILDDLDYVQVVYLVAGKVKFFTYVFGSGGIYEIDTALKTDDGLGEFYPRIYTRLDYKDIADSHDEQRKKSISKLLRLFDLKLAKITKQLNKAIGKELNDTVYMYLDMCVSINKDTWDFATSKYLFRYFNQLYTQCKPIQNSEYRKGIIQVVADNVTTQSVGFDEIKIETITGVATHQVDKKALHKGDYTVHLDYQSTSGGGGLMSSVLAKIGMPVHRLIYQITDDSYQVITVVGLKNTHTVYGKNQTISGHDENLTIPLDRELVKDLSQKEKERLFYKCLHVQIGIRKVVKVKWYQRGIFKVVMALVGIAIAYFTAGAGTPISQILLQAGMNALTGLAISFAVDVLVKVAIKLGFNAKIVGIIAFVGSVFTMVKGNISSSSLKAVDIMKALNHSFEAHNKMIGYQIQDVQKQMGELSIYAKNAYAKLKKQQEMLLTHTVPLDLELLTSPTSQRLLSNLGENALAFYNRTMTVDVKEITLGGVSNYVAISLQLPDYQAIVEQINQQQQKRNEPLDIQYVLLV